MHSKALASAEQLSILRAILMALVLGGGPRSLRRPGACRAQRQGSPFWPVQPPFTCARAHTSQWSCRSSAAEALLEFQRLGARHPPHHCRPDFSEADCRDRRRRRVSGSTSAFSSRTQNPVWGARCRLSRSTIARRSARGVIDPCLRAALRARGVDLDVSERHGREIDKDRADERVGCRGAGMSSR